MEAFLGSSPQSNKKKKKKNKRKKKIVKKNSTAMTKRVTQIKKKHARTTEVCGLSMLPSIHIAPHIHIVSASCTQGYFGCHIAR